MAGVGRAGRATRSMPSASEVSSGACPDCPGPRVPHHCGLVSAGCKGKDDAKGKGKGKGSGKGRGAAHILRECTLPILEGEAPRGFAPRGRLLGKGGENFKYICQETGVRLILENCDGRDAAAESEEPTHVRVVADSPSADFAAAVRLVRDLIASARENTAFTREGSGRSWEPRSLRGDPHAERSRSAATTTGLLKAAVEKERANAKELNERATQAICEAQEKAKSIMKQIPAGVLEGCEKVEHLEKQIEDAKRDALESKLVAIRRVREGCGYPALLGQPTPQMCNLQKPIQVRILEHSARQAKENAKMESELVGELKSICENRSHKADALASVAKHIRSRGLVNDAELLELKGLLTEAATAGRAARAAEQQALDMCAARAVHRPTGPPADGVTIERCGASQIADLSGLWAERKARYGHIVDAWKVDNPLLTWHFNTRREELKKQLGRAPDELQGYHGTHPSNVLSICTNGFDRSKRAGQVHGAGEYFAKCPDVSVSYCKGGQYMLICRLCLGVPSSTEANSDGDHIWVPSCAYYVISSPAQVLPVYIVKFSSAACGYSPAPEELQKVLEAGRWTTKKLDALVPVPRNRRCTMSRPSATVLWIGFLHAHLSDQQLTNDVRNFLNSHAPEHMEGLKVQVVKGNFKKAHAILKVPMPREVVHRLNRERFVEGGIQRTVCVEDAHGSPEQKCPKWIAGYCRGQNLRFTHPCWCFHPKRETEDATYYLEDIVLSSAKGNEIIDKFMKSAPFHDGAPRIVAIKAIINHTLARCHEGYRQYLSTKHGEEPTVRELYHGTNNNILDVLYTHGLQPPSDVSASDACPVSGGKGLCTTLCGNDCRHCTKKHEWNKCHMFGLGIYLADIAQKSHRYCSQPENARSGRRLFRMVVCSVLGRAFTVDGHLRRKEAMHDVVTVRTLQEDDLAEMIEPRCRPCAADMNGMAEVAEKSDLMFVQGLGCGCRPGFSVVNSEYIAFHPHQCLPKYEVTYEM